VRVASVADASLFLLGNQGMPIASTDVDSALCYSYCYPSTTTPHPSPTTSSSSDLHHLRDKLMERQIERPTDRHNNNNSGKSTLLGLLSHLVFNYRRVSLLLSLFLHPQTIWLKPSRQQLA